MNYPRVRWDRSANAASIDLGESSGPRRGLPVEDGDGNVVAVLRFSPEGELVEVELLEADVQLPKIFRD
ncbi:DUF2283 domain-containing protein [Amycolatopsis alkalitolerans]|uniref:DUF2283 domain-containing protein n=1 Tax=Amycolatopsis alkalitolerans TaxID=2547244 RepID=A0A5C4LYR4_9PSEU|nr:DUF2283 domain-containing protein [Amycolatopsis alkalitolerans]TNC23418.1 DUF2283 domain-containing protein [Amycolatopsis alkalitolerans]